MPLAIYAFTISSNKWRETLKEDIQKTNNIG